MESNNLEYFKKLYNVGSDVMADHQQKMGKLPADLLELILHSLNAQQVYWLGVLSYFNEFSTPFWTSLNSFLTKEKEKIREVNLLETMHDYIELYKFNIQIAEKRCRAFYCRITGLSEKSNRKIHGSFHSFSF